MGNIMQTFFKVLVITALVLIASVCYSALGLRENAFTARVMLEKAGYSDVYIHGTRYFGCLGYMNSTEFRALDKEGVTKHGVVCSQFGVTGEIRIERRTVRVTESGIETVYNFD